MSLYAVLGNTELDIVTWLDGFEARFAAEWPEQGLIGRKSLIQHTGYMPDEMRLRVALHSQWCDPGTEFKRLKDKLDAAEPMPFVLGTGEYRGIFVLTELAATTRQTDGFGALIALEAELTLKESIGDPAAPAAPAILLPGWQAPVTAAGDIADVPIAAVFADSPAGGAAATIGQAVSAMGRAADAVDALASLESLARVDALAAVSISGGVARRLADAGLDLPVEAVSAISAIATTADALADARNVLGEASFALGNAEPGSVLTRARSALYLGRAALMSLDAARALFAPAAAAIAARTEATA